MLSATSSTSPAVSPPVVTNSEPDMAALSSACALLVLMAQTQSATASGSKTDVEIDFKKMEELKKQLADAIQQAKDAANSSGFFGFLGNIFGGDIATIIGAVATIAAVVATGGAAAPLAVVLLAEGLQAAAKLGPELGLDPKICMALGIAAAAVGFASGAGAGQAVGDLAAVSRGVELGAHVAQTAATVTGGALHFVSARYHANELGFQADATGYRAANDATDLDLDDALSLLQRALKTGQRETQAASALVQDDSDTNAFFGARIRS